VTYHRHHCQQQQHHHHHHHSPPPPPPPPHHHPPPPPLPLQPQSLDGRFVVQTVAAPDGPGGYGGFTPRAKFIILGLQKLLSVIHRVYLAAYVVAYIGRDYQMSHDHHLTRLIIVVTPVPVILSMIFVRPITMAR
jgi:hypothetical protein